MGYTSAFLGDKITLARASSSRSKVFVRLIFWTLQLMFLVCFRPSNREELFNLRHSSLRQFIERMLGVLKLWFKILAVKFQINLKQQYDKFIACTCVHNMKPRCNGKSHLIFWEAEHSSNKESRISVKDTAEDYNSQTATSNHYPKECENWRDGMAEAMWKQYVATSEKRFGSS